jgi:Chlorophyll A-B binding protein
MSTDPPATQLETTQLETTQPEAVDSATPAFGWTAYAEQINGRFAMIGFVALLLLELVTQQDFFTWIGWR